MARIGKVTPKYLTIEDVKRERNEPRKLQSILQSAKEVLLWMFYAIVGGFGLGWLVLYAMSR